MQTISKFKNGLTLIKTPMNVDSVTALIAVKAGSRYENKKNNGISHFLEHMFFKGSKKYPSAQMIAEIVDSMGAINNAATSKEWTFYFIKSASDKLTNSLDILSSMLSEPLFDPEEIDREKGVIIEELRMYRDNPQRYIWDLFENLLFGDQPIGWGIGGSELTVKSFERKDFIDYVSSLYSPTKMSLVIAGNIMLTDAEIESYFNNLPHNKHFDPVDAKLIRQTKPVVNLTYKKSDQAHVVLGTQAYDRHDTRKYAAQLLATILGEGMSSRLFISVRERRGLAYHVNAGYEGYSDCGLFAVYAGLKLEKVDEGISIIINELNKIRTEVVSIKELEKAKQIIKGRLAIRSESTNYMAETFGTDYLLDGRIESFDRYLQKINQVTTIDIQNVAADLFKPSNLNLQVIGPFRSRTSFEKILSGQ